MFVNLAAADTGIAYFTVALESEPLSAVTIYMEVSGREAQGGSPMAERCCRTFCLEGAECHTYGGMHTGSFRYRGVLSVRD